MPNRKKHSYVSKSFKAKLRKKLKKKDKKSKNEFAKNIS